VNLLKKSICSALLLGFSSLVWAAQEYEINSCEDLPTIANDMTGTYYLVNNIDCLGTPIYPIPGHFLGALVGNGNTIANLHIIVLSDQGNDGLFEVLGTHDSTVRPRITDIHFENARVDGGRSSHRGLIAGVAYQADLSNITVQSLYVNGGESGVGNAGGVLGYAEKSILSEVHLSTANITRGQYGGGLIGVANLGTQILDSSVNQLKSGYETCGGDIYAFGGLVGAINNTNEASSKVQIMRSSAQGSITVEKNGGGLVGRIPTAAYVDILESYSNVAITAVRYAGGIIGLAVEDNPYSPRGNVLVKHVYARGSVNLDGDKGGRGIVGNKNKSTSRIKSEGSFFDKDGTGKEYSGDEYTHYVYLGDKTHHKSKGLTSSEMKNAKIFTDAGWSADVWNFGNGAYPTLK